GLWVDRLDTPIGTVLVAADATHLRALEFEADEARFLRPFRARDPELEVRAGDPWGAAAALRAYFAGELHAIDDLPARGDGTPFEQRVWAELRRIPVGATSSYGGLASRIGAPGSSRAVGRANGRNPISIVVPCHRVIGADGTLTGY